MLASLSVILQALSDEQVLQLSLVTLFVVQGLKIVYVGLFKRPKPGKNSMRLVVFVLSVPIGYFYSGVAAPVYGGDPLEFAQELIFLASGVLIWSGLAYDYILGGVFGWLDQPITKRLGRALLAP